MNCNPYHFLQQFLQRFLQQFLQRFLHGSYSSYKSPMRVRISAKAFHRRTAPPAQCGDGTDGCRQKITVSINEQHRERLCLRGTCKIRSDAYACLFRVESLPVPSEKTSPLHSPDPSLGCGQPAPPLQCWWLRNTVLKQEWNVFFRTGKPVPISELLATNIASTGGAGVRRGEDGGDVFFARDGPGCDGVALLCLRARVRH